MSDQLSAIDGNKRICTGVGLQYETPLDPQVRITTKESFDSLVSEYYTLFRESIAADVAFLRSIEDHRRIGEFDNGVYLLRTAKQHNDNARAVKFYEDWITKYPDWQVAANRLTDALIRALDELVRVSGRVRRDPALASSWRERALVDTMSIFDAVCRDLHVNFSLGFKKVLIRNVDRRLKGVSPNRDTRTAVEDLCVQEVTAQGRSLPVPYYLILDRLGLLGGTQAKAVLLIAYSISDSTSLRDEEFLRRVEDTWKVAGA